MTTIREQWKKNTAKYRETEKYKDGVRDYWYRSRYGISRQIYDQMLEDQNHICKICHKPEKAKNNSGNVKPLAVDHCHTTGKVRGLICHSCNVLLGRAYDDVTILKNAITYLEEYK